MEIFSLHPLICNMLGALDYLPVDTLELVGHAKSIAGAWQLARLDGAH